MAEIRQQVKAPSSAPVQQGQSKPTPQSRPQQSQSPRPAPGVVVDVNNQPAAQSAPKRVLIDKNQLEQFLQRHPEVLQAMAQEMQQAAGAGEIVPQAIPVNQGGSQINQQVSSSPDGEIAPVSLQQSRTVQIAPNQQGNIRRLVTMPATTPPSSPYGIGEMNMASRVDITSLDTHAELYQTDFTIKPVSRPLKAYQKASGAYAHQATIDPIRYVEDDKRKNNPERQHRLQSAQQIKSALQTALTAAQVAEGKSVNEVTVPDVSLTNRSIPAVEAAQATPTQQNASQLAQPAPDNSIEQRKADILPFAERYARSLGYSPEKGETEKILQDTVNFYGKSDKLANTLKNLVQLLPPT